MQCVICVICSSEVHIPLSLTDLSPFTEYNVTVAAITEAGEGPFSSKLTNTTPEGCELGRGGGEGEWEWEWECVCQ